MESTSVEKSYEWLNLRINVVSINLYKFKVGLCFKNELVPTPFQKVKLSLFKTTVFDSRTE